MARAAACAARPFRVAFRRARWCACWPGCCWRPPTACPAAARSGAATRRGWSTWSARRSSRSTGSAPQRDALVDRDRQPPRRLARRRRGAGGDHQPRRRRWPSTRASTRCAGPGLVVTLNDAQRDAKGRFPRDASPDDLVVHQQDIQAVLNALWSAGAEGIQMQDQRIIAHLGAAMRRQHAAAQRPHLQPAVRHHRDRRRRRPCRRRWRRLRW